MSAGFQALGRAYLLPFPGLLYYPHSTDASERERGVKGMWRTAVAAIAAIAGTTVATAQTYHPFDTSRLKGPHVGPHNELLVLGSPHLSGMPAAFQPEQLQPVLDKLAAWHPQAIAIEALSGTQCDFMRHHPDRYKDSVEAYCWDPESAGKATGLDVPSATTAWGRLLTAWPATPSAADRRHLAALFLAGGEGASALVQWLRLAESERHVGEGLDATLVARLETPRISHTSRATSARCTT